MIVKILIASGLYWYALDYIEATYSPIILNRVYYYIYTLGVFVAFLAYMLNRWLPSCFGKNQR